MPSFYCLLILLRLSFGAHSSHCARTHRVFLFASDLYTYTTKSRRIRVLLFPPLNISTLTPHPQPPSTGCLSVWVFKQTMCSWQMTFVQLFTFENMPFSVLDAFLYPQRLSGKWQKERTDFSVRDRWCISQKRLNNWGDSQSRISTSMNANRVWAVCSK
jgi:hypothetical protein